MKKYQIITLVLLLLFFVGAANRSEKDIHEISTEITEVLLNQETGLDLAKLEEFGIKELQVADNGMQSQIEIEKFESYLNKRFPQGFESQNQVLKSGQIFSFWGETTGEFKYNSAKEGIIKIKAWRVFNEWTISSIELEF